MVGDYLIVGKPFDRDWMAWRGSLDGWGSFGQEMRFSSFDDTANSGYLRDARKSAEREVMDMGSAVYIAKLPFGEMRGVVYHGNNVVAVDFTDDDLTPRQMREMGVL